MNIRLFICTMIAVCCSSAIAAAPFVISADGQEVTDGKTGLIWRRCAEGMLVNAGTCIGIANTYDPIDQAFARANAQSIATGLAWRVPSVKELASIADKSSVNPAIDVVAFPNTPAGWFRTSTGTGTFIDFSVGKVLFGSGNPFLRLVRGGQ